MMMMMMMYGEHPIPVHILPTCADAQSDTPFFTLIPRDVSLTTAFLTHLRYDVHPLVIRLIHTHTHTHTHTLLRWTKVCTRQRDWCSQTVFEAFTTIKWHSV